MVTQNQNKHWDLTEKLESDNFSRENCSVNFPNQTKYCDLAEKIQLLEFDNFSREKISVIRGLYITSG